MTEILKNIDILQLDDEPFVTENAQKKATSLNIQYEAVDTLGALRNALQKVRAKIYLVDGRFPIEIGESVEFNADKAITLIRQEVGANALIILVSGELKIQSIARDLRVEYMCKGDSSIQEIMENIRVRLDEIEISQVGDSSDTNQYAPFAD